MWYSAANAKLGATLVVRASPFISVTVSLALALYDADKQAHEEAVKNGGVRRILLSLIPNSETRNGLASLILVWDT